MDNRMYEDTCGDYELAAKFVKFLISESKEDLNKLSLSEKFRARYISHNESVLRGMRKAFKTEFKTLCDDFNNPDCLLNDDQKHSRLTRYLCLLPLANIKPGNGCQIPEFNTDTNRWELIPYRVSPIELLPTSGAQALVLEDYDRSFAYGLTPLNKPNEGARFKPQPHLVLTNPLYPNNQAYFTQIFLNFESVSGRYEAKKQRFREWLKSSYESCGETKARIHGMGLAGKLAYMPLFDNDAKPYISRVDIHDAYGLSETLTSNYEQEWQNSTIKPEVHIQLAKNHYNIGKILPGWYAFDENRQIDNKKFYNGYAYNFAASIILGGLVQSLLTRPMHYLVIPLCRTILKHKMELALISALIMIFCMVPWLLATTAGVAVTVMTAAYVAYKLIEPIKVLLGFNEKDTAKCHKIDAIEEKEVEDNRAATIV
ncbi:MAG: hypothetical protein P1U74_03680 [Legionellaceae bacterium]|nr:hypothetical protein [Legionellaceae bacterium]